MRAEDGHGSYQVACKERDRYLRILGGYTALRKAVRPTSFERGFAAGAFGAAACGGGLTSGDAAAPPRLNHFWALVREIALCDPGRTTEQCGKINLSQTSRYEP